MRKGIQIQRRQIVALILLFLILVELGAALFFVGLHFASIGSFDNLSPTDLVPAIAALGCIIVGIFAGRRSYAILARKGRGGPGKPRGEEGKPGDARKNLSL